MRRRGTTLGMVLALALPLVYGGVAVGQDMDDMLSGKARPPQIPVDWIGSSTRSAPGWRWDDPSNPGNSVRLFRGDPNDPDPWRREPFVVVVRDGRVVGRDGQPVPGAVPQE